MTSLTRWRSCLWTETTPLEANKAAGRSVVWDLFVSPLEAPSLPRPCGPGEPTNLQETPQADSHANDTALPEPQLPERVALWAPLLCTCRSPLPVGGQGPPQPGVSRSEYNVDVQYR